MGTHNTILRARLTVSLPSLFSFSSSLRPYIRDAYEIALLSACLVPFPPQVLSFSVLPCLIKGKQAISSSQNLLLLILKI
jgi:hypothetical protein